MITEWLEKIELRIAETTVPDVVKRLGESSVTSVIENRMVDGYYQPEEEDDAITKMPFFVLTVPQLVWRKIGYNNMTPSGAIEVAYFEHAKPFTSIANTQVQHRLSHRYFVDFFGAIMYTISGEADLNSQLGLTGIQQVQEAMRTPLKYRDPDEEQTDYWSMAFQFLVGGGGAGQ